MANTATTDKEFRKVDIDQYDENNYQEDKVENVDFDSANVQSLLTKGDVSDALKLIVNSPALEGNSREAKVKMIDSFSRVIQTVKSADIPKQVEQLNEDEKNRLMKLIYCAFVVSNTGDFSSLHTWHEKLLEMVGLGGIIRVLTDRKAVPH